MFRESFCLGDLDRFIVDADPAFWRALFLMRFGLVFCGVALATFFYAIVPSGLENFAVEAAPPASFAIPNRVLFGPKALTAFLPTILSVGAENLSVHTAPMTRLTIPHCLLWARVTLSASGLAIGGWANVDHSIDAAVTPLRREALMVTATTFRTGQRPRPTVRRVIWTISMRSATAVPLIATAITLPPPAALILFPNPLTTRVTPSTAIN